MGEDINITVGNNQKCPIEGIGMISLIDSRQLSDVLYVPKLCKNLLSISKITYKNHCVLFDKHNALVLDCNDHVVTRGVRKNNFYEMSTFIAHDNNVDISRM